MKNKKLLALVVAASMAATGVLTACGNDKKAENNTNKKNNVASKDDKKDGESKADEKQEVIYPISSDPKTLDPSRSSDTDSSRVNTHYMEGLTRITQENGKDKIVPGMAESWEKSEDGLTWTFHLRDAKWSDGEPVTAQQFEYGIKRTLAPDTGSVYAFILYPIKNATEANNGEVSLDEVGVKAIDDKTLQFTLTNPTAYFLDLTYFKVMVPQRQEIVEKYGEVYGSEAEQMIGNGPFKLAEWTRNNRIVFEKNPNYYDAESIKLDRIEFKVIVEPTSQYNAMLSGMIDMVGVSQKEWMEKFDATGEYTYNTRLKPSSYYDYFNQNSRYFKNDKIRKAFIVAQDRVDANEIRYDGKHEPAFAWIPPTVQIGGEDFRDKANSLPVENLIKDNPDPKALLIEGLKELGEDPDPSKVTIKILSTAKSEKGKNDLAYRMQVFKDVLGVNIEPDIYEWAVFQKKVRAGEFEIASAGWTGDYNDPNTFLDIFTTGQTVVNTGWSNEKFDKLILDAAKEVDQEKRFEMFKEAERILIYEDGVISPDIFARTSMYNAKYLKNWKSPLFGTIDFTRAYIEGRN